MIILFYDLDKTEIYTEIINAITRGDQEAAELQIMAAESLVRSYMSKYDTGAIFGTEVEPPTEVFWDSNVKRVNFF